MLLNLYHDQHRPGAKVNSLIKIDSRIKGIQKACQQHNKKQNQHTTYRGVGSDVWTTYVSQHGTQQAWRAIRASSRLIPVSIFFQLT
jgi:hypothetical protein